MAALSRLLSFLRRLARGRRAEQDLDESVRAYVDLLADEKVRAGLDPARARREALVEAGGVEQVKEQVRDVRAGHALETFAQDLRYAARTLARAPSFTIVAVLALALGVGANAAIFSVVNAVLLKSLPYAEADRLVAVLHVERDPVAPGNFLDWRRDARTVRLAAAEYWTPNLAGGDSPERVVGLRVTADLFPVLGVPPMLGRLFRPDEGAAGADHVVLIGYGLWQRQFGGDSAVVGRAVRLSGETYTVVGVMPRGFVFAPFWATDAEIWAAEDLSPRAAYRTSNSLRVFGRLADGATLEQARAEIGAITARLEAEYPGTNRDVVVSSLRDLVVGDVRSALWVLLGAVGFVLLIACANVVHMMLARAAGRERELALRTALGASRGRLARQLLTESALLGLLGGAAGALVAVGGIRLLAVLRPASLPNVTAVTLDGTVLGFLLVVSLVTGLACGLVPALRTTTVDLTGSLKEGARGSGTGAGRHRLRGLLVVTEFALALVLMAGAGLMLRSFAAMRATDPGLDPHHVLTMAVSVSGAPQGEPGLRAPFFHDVVSAAGALPGVVSVSAINHVPIAGDVWGSGMTIEGRPVPPPGERPSAVFRVVLPGYFRTMGIRVLKGRDIAAADDSGAAQVVVVNRKLADQHWPGEDPIGRRLRLGMEPPEQWRTVIGVVDDVIQEDWTSPRLAEVYLPYDQSPTYRRPGPHTSYLSLVVRAAGDPTALVPALRHLVRERGASVAISQIQTMDDVAAEAVGGARFYLVLLGAFAMLALALAAVGIYGVMSHAVARRTHEIGVRMALGARPGEVLGQVVGRGMALAAGGAALGLAGALALTRLMTTLLFGVRAGDPATFAAAALVLTAVALAASFIPARRATRIDPVRALRQE